MKVKQQLLLRLVQVILSMMVLENTIVTGAGNDSVVGVAGNNTIVGAGNDTVTVSTFANLTSGDTIDGGDGTDTLSCRRC